MCSVVGMNARWLLVPMVLVACSMETQREETESTDDLGDEEQALTTGMLDSEEIAFLTQINSYRVGKGLPKLHVSIALTRASDAHSKDMAAHDKMQHDSFNGTTWDARVKSYYNYNTYIGENVAYGYVTGVDVFGGWKNSPPHNANMLGTNYTVIGIARAQASNGTWYWTTDFGGQTDAILSAGFGTILSNGSFESSAITTNVSFGAVRTLSRWHTAGSVARRSGGAAAGTYSMRETDKDPGSASLAQVVRGAANVNYRVTAKTRLISGDTQAVYLDFLDGSFNRIQVHTVATAASATWTAVQVEATSPPGTKYVRVIGYGSGASGHAGSVDYDDVRLVAF